MVVVVEVVVVVVVVVVLVVVDVVVAVASVSTLNHSTNLGTECEYMTVQIVRVLSFLFVLLLFLASCFKLLIFICKVIFIITC